MGKFFQRLALATVVLSAACTTSQTVIPPTSGPSELAQSLRVTATPDSLPLDGAAMSTVEVTAFDFSGRTCANLPVRMDMGVNGIVQDIGSFVGSSRTITTGTDGKAHIIYRAPGFDPSAGGSGMTVTILATPSSGGCGSNAPIGNFDTVNRQFTSIRLVPPDNVPVLPPANAPTPKFTFPTPVNANVATLFDASSSCPRGVDQSGACLPPNNAGATITNYAWSFGDGGSANGQTALHTFRSAGAFVVTLTVTNDRGASKSTTQTVTVAITDKPTVDFVWSPQPVLAKAVTTFNGAVSTAASGHQITNFSWDFGDGTTGSGASVTHVFSIAQTYKVVLTVTDDTGQSNTTSKDIAVLTGNPIPAIVSVPGPAFSGLVTVDASNTQTFGGASVASFVWDFGDGTPPVTTTNPRTSHTYAILGAHTVQLTVTDTLGRSATATASVSAP